MARVLVEYGEGRKIAKLLGCTPKMVCEALSGKKDTPLARPKSVSWPSTGAE